ncbi:nucleotidyltransferase domain-containing protein [Candidatus Peregrinibacteria bacterium]|nr:nucleotidyltransferase domain-containing protein [Candidatus Peregrinibacteria bacterium]
MNKQKELKKLKLVTQRIVDLYNPEKIILFGSYAWGKPNKHSDVDLFVIKKTKDSYKTARKIDGEIFPRPFPMDIMVYDPKRVGERLELGDFFIRDIITKGKVLYAKKRISRMV